MSNYIKRLIQEGEHQTQDFKFEISDTRKIARTIAAFANTNGGKLLVGVKDNGAIAGVRSEEEIFMLEAAASLYCKPEVPFKAQKWVVQGKTVLEIDIARADKLVAAPTPDGTFKVYIRVNDENFLVNSIYLKVQRLKSRSIPAKLELSEDEQRMFRYLEAYGQLSFSKLLRLMRLPKKMVESMLVSLIIMDVVRMEFTQRGVFYEMVNQ